MSLIGLDEVFPNLPRPGWPGRRRAIARAIARLILGALLLIALLGIVFVYMWLGAPQGAGWPS